MIRAYKFRLYPTTKQRRIIETTLERCRELYNAALQERREAWRVSRKHIAWNDQQNALPEIKRIRPDLAEVNSQVLQNVTRRAARAYDLFFRSLRDGRRAGPPRFQSARRYDSFTHPNVYWKLDQRRMKFPAIGVVRWKPWKKITDVGHPKTMTIKREADGYYAVIACELPQPSPLAPSREAIGLDFGLKHLIVTDTGAILGDLNPLKRIEKQIRDVQRKKDHRHLGSRRRERACVHLARLHQHLARTRKAQLDVLSRALVNRYGTICIEDLNVIGLLQIGGNTASGRGLRRNKHHASWAQLRDMLTYKAEEAGRQIVAVSAHGTTQNCSACGTCVPKTLSTRTHVCTCGLTLDRDVNAARNILQRGLQLLRRETPDTSL